jgi:Gpi18-like mannosyltransferase
MKSIWKVLLVAFIFRLAISLLGEHGDVINYYWWGKDLLIKGIGGFYERNIANAMRPTYPPVTSYVFWLSAYLHEGLWKLIWLVNIGVKWFPSNLVFWFESERGWYFINKIPAILADLAIGYVVYEFVRSKIDERKALLASFLFLFIPPFWYNSSLWGQTDSLYALPLMLSLIKLSENKKVVSAFWLSLAFLVKPTAAYVLPVYLIFWFKNIDLRKFLYSLVVCSLTVFLLYFPFHSRGTIPWVFNFYIHSLSGELDYLVANSFNLWALIFGFNNRPDFSLFVGIQANTVGYLLYLALVIFLIIKNLKIKNDFSRIFILGAIFSYLAFLLLPRMHERYFYPALLLMVIPAVEFKNIMKVFLAASVIHLINLYHFWWVPKISFLVSLFSNPIIEKTVILINFVIFLSLVRIFRRNYVEEN